MKASAVYIFYNLCKPQKAGQWTESQDIKNQESKTRNFSPVDLSLLRALMI